MSPGAAGGRGLLVKQRDWEGKKDMSNFSYLHSLWYSITQALACEEVKRLGVKKLRFGPNLVVVLLWDLAHIPFPEYTICAMRR